MATTQRFILLLAAALPFISKLMPRGTLTSGDRRYDTAGNELVLVHNYATTTPRRSLWSVVDHSNELRIVDFGPKGPKHRRSRKEGVVGLDAKRFSNAEWMELLRRSREMSAAAPADIGVQGVRDMDVVDEGSDAGSEAGDGSGGGTALAARSARRGRAWTTAGRSQS